MDAREIAEELSVPLKDVLLWLMPDPSGGASFVLDDIRQAKRLGLINETVTMRDRDGLALKCSLTDLGRQVASLLRGEADE